MNEPLMRIRTEAPATMPYIEVCVTAADTRLAHKLCARTEGATIATDNPIAHALRRLTGNPWACEGGCAIDISTCASFMLDREGLELLYLFSCNAEHTLHYPQLVRILGLNPGKVGSC